ncbi:gluconate 5-dehydrogenase [Yersinia similis]
MDVFTASLRSACSLRRGHFVNNLKASICVLAFLVYICERLLF